MAAAGTVTQVFNNEGALVTTVAGVTVGATSQVFGMKTAMYSSFTLSGTFGGTSGQWQGSNDAINWANIGVPVTVAGAGTLTPNQVFYAFYQLALTGGDGTTAIAATVVATIPR